MPTRSNKKLAVIERRQHVAELALQGLSQTSIAEHLSVNQGTVSHDLKIIRQEWRDSAVRDFDEARSVELQKLDLIERESWAAWQRSQKPQQSAMFTGDTPGPQAKKSLANRYGDPRFLEQVNKCIAQRRSLLGLDIPAVESHKEGRIDDSGTLEVRRERVFAVRNG